ncbi:chaperone modulator CbpM [Christiangramia sabulilitoris]|uniref:MerR family transcriptional regulator n=1 Tax=Christiangramia sabulilitoris TaxID=2583991 RepID=A0A550I8T1_9FLAO|nr:chaperone modulator CbpM [Christiangramia sabulilitoris]TRO67238.1 MerR family transcriptional regulator [Christiangramia sabulilitoris]
MNYEDLIPADEICVRYKVERQFVSSLYESGIIQIVRIKETEYIPNDHLADFERMMRLHRELDINLAGLEAVNHLLKKIDQLNEDNMRLRNRLGLYE